MSFQNYQLMEGMFQSSLLLRFFFYYNPYHFNTLLYQVVQAVQDHYNCSTLNGSLLENEGASSVEFNSHWESRVLFPEIMNARLYDDLAK